MERPTVLGPMTPARPPTVGQLRKYNVNREGNFEVIWQPLYDYLAYAAAGQTSLTFFQRTVGSAATVTLANTNMRAAGSLPRPQEFLVTGIQVNFRPLITQLPSSTAAAAAILPNQNDAYEAMFADSWLELFIGSKAYLDDAPIAKFTSQWGFKTHAQATGTFGAGTFMAQGDYGQNGGRYYSITPVKIPANQNFNVTLNWPTAVAITAAGTIGVVLDGFLYRLSQ